MELLVAVDALDDLVLGARRVPLTDQVRLDVDELQRAVTRIREVLTAQFGLLPGSDLPIAELVRLVDGREAITAAARPAATGTPYDPGPRDELLAAVTASKSQVGWTRSTANGEGISR